MRHDLTPWAIMLTVIAAIALAIMAWPVRAEPAKDKLDQRVTELIEFVTLVTDYKVTTRPKILFRDTPLLGKIAGFPAGSGVRGVAIGNVIFLPADFELGRDDDLLLHELVHFAQFENGKDGNGCAGRLEPEAYRIQDAFNASRGDPRRSDAFTVFTIVMACDAE